MLTATRQQDGVKVVAAYVDKSHGPFLCTSCQRPLILNKGRIRVHHFRHPPQVARAHGQGESLEHLHCKMEIFDALAQHASVTDVELEKHLGPVVADVFAYIHGQPVAVEVQRSVLSVAEIRERTQAYTGLGINVLWIAVFPDAPTDTEHSPKACERWLHAAYLGRVYYWVNGLSLRPVHFDDMQLPVDGRSWIEPGGARRFSSPYTRTSQRYRTPCAGPLVDLVNDFRPRLLGPFAGGTIDVPQRRLFLDRRPRWWQAIRPD
ncbi:competence protein CoiA [Pigmentiphaga aceris]|uniref:Competence protein CoiA n=1 Tax=Pigmentiphaga aceris TaxID=1940612 RepID=A0A5C0B4R8_9BURK|nr:competence protein CoiA family protein [Pigmentiphaga aceris]QEI08856.1 competence protein CoiA [Pigmentiphaga aceris]